MPARTRAPVVARGVSRLAFEGVEQLTRVVEAMHANIAAAPLPFGRGTAGRTRGLTGFVYECIRFVNRGAYAVIDGALDLVPPRAGSAAEASRSETWVSVLNGVLGDHLAASGNPLAIPMQLRRAGEPSARIVVLIHGLCMSDRQWMRNGHDHGEALARDLGVTPVYVHYNTGRHVSENGRELAGQLEALIRGWPVAEPELAIVGYSMGGLIARSACHYASEDGQAWLARLAQLVFLGTPHHGAPLERGGNWAAQILGVSPYSAPLARLGALRSAGITDLRHGSVRDEDWRSRDRFACDGDGRVATPLPAGVACFALAGTGDMLAPVASALGRHSDPRRSLAFDPAHCWIGEGLDHFDLLDRPEVYAWLRENLAVPTPTRGD
ncbi:MAG TPA: alpha/beta hydrolase [Myxococcota bacterium]|nr:alpha/beta hydrolase [Myxococcota bacterium]